MRPGSGTEPPGHPASPPGVAPCPVPHPRGLSGVWGTPSPSCPRGLIARISTRLGLGDPAGVWGHPGTPQCRGPIVLTAPPRNPIPCCRRTIPKNVTFGVTPRWRERRGRFGASPSGFIRPWRFSPALSLGFLVAVSGRATAMGTSAGWGWQRPKANPAPGSPFPHRGGETGGDSALRSGSGSRRDPPKAAVKPEPPRRRLVAGARPAPQPELSRVTQL